MTRIFTTIVAAALLANGWGLIAGAQEPPPPEGAPIQGNPYGAPSEADASSTAVNKALLAKAKKWFLALQAGKIDRSQMESGPNANANDATIDHAPQLIAGLGAPTSFVQQSTGKSGNLTYGEYLVTFRDEQRVYFLFAVDGQGKVASLALGTPR
jgi:hypothetical protein